MNAAHQEMIDRIESSAERLKRVIAEATPDKLTRRPSEGEWSVVEVLTHTWDAVMLAYSSRLRRLLIEDNPAFVDYDLDAYAQANPRRESADDLLQTIIAEHDQIARILRTLPDMQWQRHGTHPQYGTWSIEQIARQVGDHAEEHAVQITKTLKALG